MSTIASPTDENGEFSISMPDGTITYCMVHSESREDAKMVCNVINENARDLEALRSGHDIVIPTSREHAHNIVLVGQNYLIDHEYDD